MMKVWCSVQVFHCKRAQHPGKNNRCTAAYPGQFGAASGRVTTACCWRSNQIITCPVWRFHVRVRTSVSPGCCIMKPYVCKESFYQGAICNGKVAQYLCCSAAGGGVYCVVCMQLVAVTATPTVGVYVMHRVPVLDRSDQKLRTLCRSIALHSECV